MAKPSPEIFALGGPNGAGKTTVAEWLLPDELTVTNFVNADFIAKALSPHAPDVAAFDAGRRLLRRIRELRESRASFAFESTLSARTFAPFLLDARAQGYVVHLVYVSLSNASLAVSRVRQRVQRGGHNIPEEVVRRRFERSLVNFFTLYLPLADSWTMWDNSGRAPSLVARGTAVDGTDVIDHARWAELSKHGANDGQ